MSALWKRRALAGLAVLGLGFGLWRAVALPQRGADSARSLRDELIAEAGPVRLLEARLAGFEYAPEGASPRVTTSLRKVARRIEAEARRQSTPESLGALALLKLLGDDGSRESRRRSAIDLLEQATLQPQAGAHLWSDLSAIHLESAEEEAWRHVLALEAALRAVQMEPDLPEARFNFALALEKSFLLAEARAAWDRYEELSSEAGWNKEAAAHRRALQAPTRAELWGKRSGELERAALRGDLATARAIVEQDPFRSRQQVELALLPSWAEAHAEEHGEQAERKLRAARVLGAVLAQEKGEHMAEDMVAAIDRLIHSGNSSLLTSLASAYGDFAEGSRLCVENEATRGEQILERARDVFAQAGSPVSAWVDYHLGVCAFQRSEGHQAVETLRTIVRRPGNSRYPSLLGRAYWMIGLAHMVLGEPAASSEAYEASLTVLEKAGALPEIAGINHMLAENRAFLGDRRQAWSFLLHGLGLAVADGEPRRLYTGLDKAADAAVLENRTAVALVFRDALVREALAQGDAPGIAHAFVRRAETRLEEGQREEARRDLDQAESAWVRIDDPEERLRREADIRLAEGRLQSSDQPAEALAALDRALEIYESENNRYPIVGAYLARARALLALGQTDAAQHDIQAGIEEFERQRGEIRNEELRIAHFDQARELFDLLISLQMRGSAGPEMAFNSAEQMRARVLLDRARGERAARPLSLGEVLRRLPSGISVVAYASLPERLLVWVLRRGTEPTMVELLVAARSLEGLVSACRRDIQRQAEGESAPACLTDLHERVLAPVLPQIPAADRIVFVPDGSLHRLPFAALRDRKTGRFLVEDHASAVTPSASLYVEGGAPPPSGSPNLLVIADPRFDRGRFPLVSLDGALKEAGQIAELFGDRALVLKEESATREAFLREVGRHSIVHVGTHALLNPDHPHLSQLLLAPGVPGNAGTITAAEVERLPLPRTRLVFLASCRSGGGILASEGVLSLARSFLAAGVPEVVSSLWDLSDEPSAAVSASFYRSLLPSGDGQASLRQAQLALIKRKRPIQHWAPFQIVGRATDLGTGENKL